MADIVTINISAHLAWWFYWILKPMTHVCVWLRLTSMPPVLAYFIRKSMRITHLPR